MSERDLRALLDAIERALGASWLDISDWLRDQNSTDAIEARLLAHDYSGVVREVEAAARMFATETHAAFNRAGQTQAAWLDSKLPKKLVWFDAKNERAIYQAQRNELELVTGLGDEQRQKLRQIFNEGTEAALNPRVMARDIRDSIGLTPRDEAALRSYRRALQEADWSNALGRELSSGHTDRTIRRVQRDGSRLTDAQIAAATERYRQGLLAARAETIARTEAGRNVHAGLEEAMRQAVERGDVEAEELRREWIHAGGGKRSRTDHRAMDGITVAWSEDFVMPSGVRMRHPHDVNAPASETANCRCTVAHVLSDVAADTKPASTAPPKNPKRQAAARVAAAASAERRREIHSAARDNLPVELHSTWDKEGHKFMREEAARIRGVKDRVNASSTLSQAFAEKYGSGAETMFGNEGDRFRRRAEIEAKHAESWADEQERKYYAAAQAKFERGEFDDDMTFTPTKTNNDDDPPF